MRLYAVKYAESVFGENYIFDGGKSDVLLPIHFAIFLFESGNKRILVDAGCDTMPGWDMKYFESPSVILERGGIPCDSITDVIITHSHHDHIEAVRYFKNAVIHIQREEYEIGKGYIPEGFRLNIFDDEYEIADGIRSVKIAGHSKGSCAVEFPMGEGIGVISGDEIYYERVLEDARSGIIPKESRPFLKRYIDSRYKVWVMHNPQYLDGGNGIQLLYENNSQE